MSEDTLNSKPYTSKIRFWITVGIVLASFVEVLDMTIVNVAMPHMMGNLSATSHQITWVVSAYIIAAAIGMPLTGYLTGKFGQKKLLIYSLIGFAITSFLCGIAQNLTQLVIFRVLQGMFGCTLIPLSQIILQHTYPKEEMNKAMAFWGMGIMVAPVMGPTLGGYITEHFGWRWIFFINLPICALCVSLISVFVMEQKSKKLNMQWRQLLLMILGIGMLQTVLDRGHQADWFHSFYILTFTVMGGFCLMQFIISSLASKDSFLNLRRFRDPYFCLSSLILFPFGIALYGSFAVTPLFMQIALNLSPTKAGLVLAPRGIASVIGMITVAQLGHKISSFTFLTVGVALSACGFYEMSLLTLDTNTLPIMTAGIVQGFGMGLFFVPNATLAFTRVSDAENAEAAGLFSLVRSLGNSFGVAIFSTYLASSMQRHWQQLGEHLSPFNPSVLHLPHEISSNLSLFSKLLEKHAMMLAFVDTYTLIAVIFSLVLPVVIGFYWLSGTKNTSGDPLQQKLH